MKVMCSEAVSVGHPDSTADYIVAYLMDQYLKEDPDTRFAAECQIKDNHVTVAGEVTSKVKFDDVKIAEFVRQAVYSISYTHEYAQYWGADNCLDCDRLDVRVLISGQSPDIAQGVENDGWGDQGIFWGMATDDSLTDNMPTDIYMARSICNMLYAFAVEKVNKIGLDIKSQVEVVNGKVDRVIVAAPMVADYSPLITDVVKDVCGNGDYKIIINGTGRYVRHSSMGDCGTTGRKLAVNFYGGNCRIGGGAVFGKDPSKADVTLNLYARKLAREFIKRHPNFGVVYVGIACCIGQKEIRITYYDSSMNVISTEVESRKPSEIIDSMKLKRVGWSCRARYGLFAEGIE